MTRPLPRALDTGTRAVRWHYRFSDAPRVLAAISALREALDEIEVRLLPDETLDPDQLPLPLRPAVNPGADDESP